MHALQPPLPTAMHATPARHATPRIFIGTMAIGYDYMLFTSMLGAFCIAIAFTLIYKKINKTWY